MKGILFKEHDMAIWMDMTNSLYIWNGGVVGIVRAELEIAKIYIN